VAQPEADLLQRLCALVDHENPEVRCAAALVLGMLEVRHPSVRNALARAANSDNEILRGYALQGLARIEPNERPLEPLIEMLAASPELARRAAAALREAGPRAVGPLVHAIQNRPPLRDAALRMLAEIAAPEALDGLYEIAAGAGDDLAASAIQLIRERIAQWGDPQALAARAAELLHKRDPSRHPGVAREAIRLLRACGGAAATGELLRLAEHRARAVRDEALRALAEMDIPPDLHDRTFRRLLPRLKSKNYDEDVRPCIHVLRRLDYSSAHFARLRALLKSEHRSVRAFAVRAIGRIGGAAAARIVLDALRDPERKVQEAAATVLATDSRYLTPLCAAFQSATDPADASRLGALLARHKDSLDARILRGFVRRALDALAGKGGLFQPPFEVVRAANPDLLRSEFLKRGVEELRRKRFDAARKILRHLDRDDLATSDSDIALAAAIAGDAPKDFARVPPELGRAFVVLMRAVRREDRNVVEELARYRAALGPRPYLFLGFHLAEKPGLEREFASALLRFVARTFRGTEEARIADRKSKAETNARR
jgi:HEAT repeat protein